MFKRKGVKGLLNNIKKNCTFLKGWLPLFVFVLIGTVIATSLPLRCRCSDLGRNCQNGNLEVTDILMSTNIQRIPSNLFYFGRPRTVIGQCT